MNQKQVRHTMRNASFLTLLLLPLLLMKGAHAVNAIDLLNAVLPNFHYSLSQASYGSHPRQQMDIYLPKPSIREANRDKPPIVFVYGGAWVSGNKQDYAFIGHTLSRLGHITIIPDYRLHPEVVFPEFIEDIARAIRYTETQANELLNQEFNQFILMGHSAGAHTAALMTVDSTWLGQHQVNAQLKGLIALAGPYDLPLDDPEVAPVFPNVSKKDSNAILNTHPKLPPVLLLHGKSDTRVYPFHTERFSAALNKTNNTVTSRLYDDVDHVMILGAIAPPLRWKNPSYRDIKQFLSRF